MFVCWYLGIYGLVIIALDADSWVCLTWVGIMFLGFFLLSEFSENGFVGYRLFYSLLGRYVQGWECLWALVVRCKGARKMILKIHRRCRQGRGEAASGVLIKC